MTNAVVMHVLNYADYLPQWGARQARADTFTQRGGGRTPQLASKIKSPTTRDPTRCPCKRTVFMVLK